MASAEEELLLPQIEDGVRPGSAGEVGGAWEDNGEEQCPVCFGLLCEPVAWPGCSHHHCLLCTLRTRQRPKPTCPLCRAPATRILEASALCVDVERAASVRRALGYLAYEAERRQLWAEASAAGITAELGILPLFCMGRCELSPGEQIGLRLFEPRYKEMIRRAVSRDGGNKFAIIIRPGESDTGEVFASGAYGRVCEILQGELATDGNWHIHLEVGTACRVVDVSAEEISQGVHPLFHGTLKEVQEDELARSGVTETLDIMGRSSMARRLLARNVANEPVSSRNLANESIIENEDAERPQSVSRDVGALSGMLMSLRSLHERVTTDMWTFSAQNADLTSLIEGASNNLRRRVGSRRGARGTSAGVQSTPSSRPGTSSAGMFSRPGTTAGVQPMSSSRPGASSVDVQSAISRPGTSSAAAQSGTSSRRRRSAPEQVEASLQDNATLQRQSMGRLPGRPPSRPVSRTVPSTALSLRGPGLSRGRRGQGGAASDSRAARAAGVIAAAHMSAAVELN